MADLSDAAGLEQTEPTTTCGLILDGVAAQVTSSSIRLLDLQQVLNGPPEGASLLLKSRLQMDYGNGCALEEQSFSNGSGNSGNDSRIPLRY